MLMIVTAILNLGGCILLGDWFGQTFFPFLMKHGVGYRTAVAVSILADVPIAFCYGMQLWRYEALFS